METSYKDIVNTQKTEVDSVEKDITYSYEDLDIEISNRKKQESSIYQNIEMQELRFGMMDKINIMKDELKDSGFMNTFSYNDICNIIEKTIEIEILPDILSDEDEDYEDEEIIGI